MAFLAGFRGSGWSRRPRRLCSPAFCTPARNRNRARPRSRSRARDRDRHCARDLLLPVRRTRAIVVRRRLRVSANRSRARARSRARWVSPLTRRNPTPSCTESRRPNPPGRRAPPAGCNGARLAVVVAVSCPPLRPFLLPCRIANPLMTACRQPIRISFIFTSTATTACSMAPAGSTG